MLAMPPTQRSSSTIASLSTGRSNRFDVGNGVRACDRTDGRDGRGLPRSPLLSTVLLRALHHPDILGVRFASARR